MLNKTQNFILKAIEKHGNEFDYSQSVYLGNKKSITIICRIHGPWQSTPNRHNAKNKKGGCPKCHPNALVSINDFIYKCNKIFNFKYDYSKTILINLRQKIIIICPIHKEFEQKALSHLQGHGCKKCNKAFEKIFINDFIIRANIIHNGIYDYSLVILNNGIKSKVNIICNYHGIFSQIANNHLNGSGCKKCGIEGQSFTTQIFIDKSHIIHNNKYIYNKTIYIKNNIKVIITCKDHGDFKQIPSHHLNGSGCPKCAHSISKSEILWLNSLNIPQKYYQQTINVNGRRFLVDAYDPEINTIYEFNGDFWHGNPKLYNANDINPATKTTFGELYNKTIEKEQFLIKNGYNIISIWESDFNEII